MTSKTQLVQQHITEKIQWKVYHVNQRIPSVRSLAKTLHVSPYTVTQAYESLVAQGAIYAQKGSGYFVAEPRKKQTQSIATPLMTNNVLDTGWLLGHLFNDLPSLNCSGSGLPQEEWLYPQDKLLKAQKKAVKSLSYVYEYGNIHGYLPLREQFAVQLSNVGVTVHPSSMITTIGVSSGIDTVIRAMCTVGDYVIVDDPCWFWMIGCLQQFGINVNVAELEYLLATYQPKLYLTNSVVHNPTSFNVSPSNVFAVLKLMEQYDCYVVEDDVYSYFVNEQANNGFIRYASLDGLNRVFYLTGVAKVLGGNWRVAVLCCPHVHLEKILRQKMLSNMTCPEITERTVYHVLQDPYFNKYLHSHRTRLQQAHQALTTKLERMGLEYKQSH